MTLQDLEQAVVRLDRQDQIRLLQTLSLIVNRPEVEKPSPLVPGLGSNQEIPQNSPRFRAQTLEEFHQLMGDSIEHPLKARVYSMRKRAKKKNIFELFWGGLGKKTEDPVSSNKYTKIK